MSDDVDVDLAPVGNLCEAIHKLRSGEWPRAKSPKMDDQYIEFTDDQIMLFTPGKRPVVFYASKGHLTWDDWEKF